MTMTQLELPFMTEDPVLRVTVAIESMEERFQKNRRALFAKTSERDKKIDTALHEWEVIKAALCRGQLEFKFT